MTHKLDLYHKWFSVYGPLNWSTSDVLAILKIESLLNTLSHFYEIYLISNRSCGRSFLESDYGSPSSLGHRVQKINEY